MKFLATFILICVVILIALTWRFMVAAMPKSLSVSPGFATESEEPYYPQTYRMTDTNEDIFMSVGPTTAPASSPTAIDEPPTTAPVIEPVNEVHWATDPQQSDARRRLNAARAVLASEPMHPVALRDELQAAVELRRWSVATESLAKLMELEPENHDWHFQYAEMLIRQQRWSSAAGVLTSIVELVPEHVEAWNYLAAAHQTLGHLQDARLSWDRVLELRPADTAARAYRGEILLTFHEWQSAADDFEQVLSQEPSHLGATLGRATALAQLGFPDSAREGLRNYLQQQPKNVLIMNRLAEICWQEYRTDPVGSTTQREATIEWCRRSLAIDATQPAIQELLEMARADE
ncbi:MAG: tetratricopeptide repeat protein [Planctomycetota bacterium]